jgi:hypothetical protein
LTITLVTLLALIIGELWGDIIKGEKWIEAKSQNYNVQPSAQDLTLRKNGTFTVYLREDDFTCYYTGNYFTSNGKIILDKETVNKTNAKMTTQYLQGNKVLIPLTGTGEDRTQYSGFDIISTK